MNKKGFQRSSKILNAAALPLHLRLQVFPPKTVAVLQLSMVSLSEKKIVQGIVPPIYSSETSVLKHPRLADVAGSSLH